MNNNPIIMADPDGNMSKGVDPPSGYSFTRTAQGAGGILNGTPRTNNGSSSGFNGTSGSSGRYSKASVLPEERNSKKEQTTNTTYTTTSTDSKTDSYRTTELSKEAIGKQDATIATDANIKELNNIFQNADRETQDAEFEQGLKNDISQMAKAGDYVGVLGAQTKLLFGDRNIENTENVVTAVGMVETQFISYMNPLTHVLNTGNAFGSEFTMNVTGSGRNDVFNNPQTKGNSNKIFILLSSA